MSFNPDKCEVIRITNKRKNVLNATYSIHGQPLQLTDKSKYLGLTFTSKLQWKEHINSIAKKANQTRGFLQRNLRKAPQKITVQAYQTFVRPTLEYAAPLWDPHTESDIDRLQMVQRRAARFVMGDWRRRSSVTAILQHLQWPSLQRRRSEAKLAMLYKIQHQLIDIPVAPNLQPLPAGLRTRGHSQRFFVPQPRVDAYKYSFVSVIPLWNGPSPETVAAPSLITFISRLHGRVTY